MVLWQVMAMLCGPDPSAAKVADVTPDGGADAIVAARDALRDADGQDEKIIRLQPGEYFLKEPLVLDARDSGLTIRSGGDVTLYGGKPVPSWQPDGDGLWSAPVPEARDGSWDFRMLSVNGSYCPRARLPEEGTFEHLTTFDVPWMSTTGGGWKRKPTQDELTTMQCRPGDLPEGLDIHNAEVTVYHMWDESVVGIESLDQATQTLTFGTPAGHPPGAFGVKRYVIWNVREGMTQPGQWYLDRSAGKVVYRPLEGEDMTQAKVIAPTMESIIRLHGTEGEPVRNVRIEGLTLSVTNTPLEAGGFGAGKFEGAISAVYAEDCILTRLTIENVGGQGVKTWNTKRFRAVHSEVRNTGACGLMVRGEEPLVAANHVHHNGLTYPSAIAVWGGGTANRILHNEIHHTPYTAIACGGDDHRIESNLIHHAMLVMKDGGGIYITFCKRVTLSGNFIRDIAEVGGYGSSAYYLDEQAEDCLVEGNLALNVPRPSHNHMAWSNTIRNNVFICDGDANLTFPKSKDYTFEKNVIMAKGTVKFSQPEAITTGAGNIIFAEAIEGEIPGVTNVDPLVTGAEEGKIEFGEGSPAFELGVGAIDVSGAGVPPDTIYGGRRLLSRYETSDDLDLVSEGATVDF